jgi:methyl-accepting chemotaxis protein
MTEKKPAKPSSRSRVMNDPLDWVKPVEPPDTPTESITAPIKKTKARPQRDPSKVSVTRQSSIQIEQENPMSVNQNATQTSLLDNLSSCIQLADENNIITYMNTSLVTMFSQAEEDIKKYLPHFDQSKLIGQSMDLFHKNPAHQKHMVASLQGKHSAKIRLGNRVFELVAAPLFDTNGKRTGSLVEWSDVSVIENISDVLSGVANGDLSKPLIDSALCSGSAAILQASADLMRSTIQGLLDDLKNMSIEHDKGDIEVFIDTSKYKGAYIELANGINDMVAAHISAKKKALTCVAEFGEGNFDAPLEKFPGKKAFINDTIEILRANLKQIIGDAISLSQSIVDGDLTQTVDRLQYQGDFRIIMDAFENAFVGLNKTFYEINSVAEQVGSSSEELKQASQNMAATAEEQSSSVEEVSASLAETDSQVKANTDNANAANQLVINAALAASQGQQKMESMIHSMSSINEASQNIAKIIKVIDEIAFQTNLLALNAAVEAARAGQHGRGFAVVAQEVRNLAGRSAKAARETATLIEDSSKRVTEGVSIVSQTRESLEQIVGGVTKVKDLVAEIAAASIEQSRGLSQISVAMSQVAKTAEGSSQQAEELASSSDELSIVTGQMRQEINRFKLREREVQQAPMSIPGLEGLTPEILRQLKALLDAQQSITEPANKPENTTKAKASPKKSPKSILPLDADERGYGDF